MTRAALIIPARTPKPRTPIRPVIRFTPAKHRRPKHPQRMELHT